MDVLIIAATLSVIFCAQTTDGQYYCNGRADVTAQWGGCNGTEAVCSTLMQAITQTWNWWAAVNNTNGSSVGVASHNFFTTDAYGELLSFTNNNTAYPTVCKKIAKIVAQLLIWNATKDANVLLGNATYVATARQELFGTVIPGWGYTIGDYIACGPTCTNYASTTSAASSTATSLTSSVTTASSGECACNVSAISTEGNGNVTMSLENACTLNVTCYSKEAICISLTYLGFDAQGRYFQECSSFGGTDSVTGQWCQ